MNFKVNKTVSSDFQQYLSNDNEEVIMEAPKRNEKVINNQANNQKINNDVVELKIEEEEEVKPVKPKEKEIKLSDEEFERILKKGLNQKEEVKEKVKEKVKEEVVKKKGIFGGQSKEVKRGERNYGNWILVGSILGMIGMMM